MENKNDKPKWGIIGIGILVVFFLVCIAYSAGQNSNNQPQSTNTPVVNNTSDQTAPVATADQNNQPKNNIVDNSDEQLCSQQAAIFWQKQRNLCLSCTYKSHYNSSQKKCFVLTTGGVISDTTSFNLVLWDIYGGVKTAQYIAMGGANYQGCNIYGVHVDGCTYNNQFGAFLNSEMETNSY